MLVSAKHKMVLLNLREPEKVLTVIPTAKVLTFRGKNIIAVPHKLEETRVLRNLGFDVPAPVSHYYDWPGQYAAPFIHQRTTVEFLTTNPRAFCLNGMGSGKTLSVLWAFDYLRKAGAVRRMLVVGPLSTLERVWADEIYRHFPDMTFAVLHGSRERRHRLLAQDFDVYIINHDGIKSKETLELILKRDDIDLVVPDELAEFRNASTDRWKCLNLLCNGNEKQGIKPREWVWGLTGTPTPKEPTDAWAQIRIVAPGRVPKFFGHFRDTVMRQVTQYKWVARETARDIVGDAMQPAVRFSREQCIDLPPTTRITRHAPLTTEQKRAFDEMLRKFKTEYAGGEISAANAAVKLSKLLQICCVLEGTEVLTSSGWMPIELVDATHKVWDGAEWVTQDGAVWRGNRQVINCDSVWLTDDHQVLSTRGWITAKEMNLGKSSGQLDWQAVRLPDSYAQAGSEQPGLCNVGMRMSMRHSGGQAEPVPAPAEATSLRVRTREQKARHGPKSAIQHLGSHAGSLFQPLIAGLRAIRRSWDQGVPRVGAVVRELLERHGGRVLGLAHAGSEEQRRSVFAGELSLGHTGRAGKQPKASTKSKVTSAGASNGHPTVHAIRPTTSWPTVGRVYDLINCGPRSRFVVRGDDGVARIVHNCGVAYGTAGEVAIPAQPRMELVKELIDEADAKALVFVPFTAALHALANFLREYYTVEVVYGDVTKTERDRIFQAFQKSKDPHVIVADARTMSHGLTLTAADTTIWYGPIQSNSVYMQANERTPRPGQKLATLIAHIEGHPIEQKVYEKLAMQGATQNALLDLLENQ